ncbi:MAG: M20/M25/M40 family metallo-hydrolase [Candidatus Aminicenantes bacterium]|nr:M20/M25/M40 family metallo-hydrolase [Candidatus Aminicenantes bacterium]
MKKYLGFLLVFLLLVTPALSKDKKVTFDEQKAWSYIKVLACDCMQGRKSGQPGAVKAEGYIASKFKEWGLEPAGDNGTYFQNFTIEHRNIAEGVKFEVITEKARRDFYYREDWRVQRYSGSGHYTAELVFIGYGIHAPEKKYDDYDGVDVKGKLVVFTTGSPKKLAKKLEEEAKMENRIKAAQEHGALGIIVFRPPSSQSRYFGVRTKKELYKPNFVILSIEDKVINFIFKELKTETRLLFQKIESEAKPQSLETGVKAFVSVSAIFDEKRATRNVLAKITGSDKKLRNEYIVIGAHMDHLGIGPMGDIYNGANDNASGTAVTMEIARVMKNSLPKPKRTVVFALWAGEEQGLLGSRHYADHAAYPIEKTIVNFNMDMVGIGSGKISFGGKYYGPQVWKLLKEKLPKEMLDYVKPGRGGPGGSDHTPFLQKGVPAFFAITENPFLKYHQPRDDSDLMEPELLKKTGRFIRRAVDLMASEPKNFIQPMRHETYYFKYQNLLNYKFEPLDHVIEKHGDTKDSHVDLQFSALEEKEGLSGEKLRIDLINGLFSASEEIKKTKGLGLFSSFGSVSRNSRMGKATVILGLKGVNSFRDDPKWAEVLAKQGIYFVLVDDPAVLFGEEGLNEEGKKILGAANKSGLLFLIKGANTAQVKALLNTSKKPLIFLEKDLPGKEIMELIKKKESALGLILGSKEDPVAYFKKLDEAKEAIGNQNLMVVNELCLWGSSGKDQMLKVISEMIKAKYERMDFSNIFSSTFMRVLRKARGEQTSSSMAFRPF